MIARYLYRKWLHEQKNKMHDEIGQRLNQSGFWTIDTGIDSIAEY